jgi:hypothetical protein
MFCRLEDKKEPGFFRFVKYIVSIERISFDRSISPRRIERKSPDLLRLGFIGFDDLVFNPFKSRQDNDCQSGRIKVPEKHNKNIHNLIKDSPERTVLNGTFGSLIFYYI